jgi:RND superfamily putative drug exporter
VLRIYIYLFVVALGTDYNILMIARLREEAREGKSPRDAAALSFGIFVAAFVMAMFFTPALTALIGQAAWWPGHGDETAQEKAQRVEVMS